ncbi:MAG TPA: GspMb/PilO family protein [Pyrinomonadaceae bacterium]|jgi:Tfp pilus assembly protein PilO|nr:GspMb/PilO family protein [Pyrinomonadaceae bacterium]
MSEQDKARHDSSLARRPQIRVRVDRLRQSRQRSIIGLPEIIGLSASGFLLLLVLCAYFFSLAPARARLETLNNERNTLQRRLHISQEGFNSNVDAQATVATINESLQRFENERLADRSEGRMVLYTQLNDLIRRNNLRNTAGPNYVALQPLGAEDQQQGANSATRQRSGNARWQTTYPGIGVNTTVEGAYQNLRRFIHDIEASKQFIVINAVELESVKDTEVPPVVSTAPPGMPGDAGTRATGPAVRGTLVSLRLDLAVYFKRGAEPEAISLAGNQAR